MFGYDALGRRVSKRTGDTVHRFGWDGNVVLHEWDTDEADRPKLVTDETGREEYDGTEKPDNLVTWVYDGTSFTPVAKVTDGERYTIVHDYLGTPTQAYDSKGELVWEMLLDVYGKVAECHGDWTLVPFRYQGQYEDEETGLYYNRFRYYDPKTGNYISQDPIGLAGGNPTLYGYVFDPNTQIDPFGLDCGKITPKYKTIQDEITQKAKRTAAVVDRWLASSNSKWANAYRNFATTNPNFAALIKGRVIDRRMNAWMRKKYDGLGVFDETIPNSGRMRPDAYFPDLDGKSVIFDIGSKSKIADIQKYDGLADIVEPILY